MAKETLIIHQPADLALDPSRGLAIIDVDEVLALFIQGFDRFLRTRGYEFRLKSFALFSNVYRQEAKEPADLAEARDLFRDFFAVGCDALEPAPGAATGLRSLSQQAQVVILTNAPEDARVLRAQWLKHHLMDYPMILSSGVKGPPVAAMASRVKAPVMFVDDLLSNLDSVAESAPEVARFQMVADPELRRLAPTDPARHRLVADWGELVGLGQELFAR